ncbi:hypothetical protein J7K74_01260 [Candidatus Woesearchaeota archaeon]|nr:hypothetical protein [Candidatus Woesearchaeota archaeon]
MDNNKETLLLYSYDLKGLPSIKKQSLTHALYGSGGRRGVIIEAKGYRIGRNNILIPLDKEKLLDEFFETWGLKPLKIMIQIERKDLIKLKKYWEMKNGRSNK